MTGTHHEHIDAVHFASGRHHAAHRRHRAGRDLRLLQAARFAAAAGGLSDHLRDGAVAGRQPRHRGDQRRRAAGAPSRADRRCDRDDLDQFGRPGAHRAAIRPGPRHQRRRARRAGGDQRGARRPADQPAQQPDLPQGEPRRRADPDPGADLEDADPRPDVRRGDQRAVATPVAASGHRPGDHRRRGAAGGAGGTEPDRAVQIRHRAGGRARRAGLGQCQQPERLDRGRRRCITSSTPTTRRRMRRTTSRW